MVRWGSLHALFDLLVQGRRYLVGRMKEAPFLGDAGVQFESSTGAPEVFLEIVPDPKNTRSNLSAQGRHCDHSKAIQTRYKLFQPFCPALLSLRANVLTLRSWRATRRA